MSASGRIGPLIAITKIALDTTIGVGAGFFSYFAVSTAKNSEPIAKAITDATDAAAEIALSKNPITSALKWIKYIFVKIPEISMLILDNLANFFYIFCVLVVLGQFDFLLDNIYATMAVSVMITYLLRTRS